MPANSNRQKYGQDYGWNGVAWCCIFVWWCFAQAHAQKLFFGGKKTASCTQLMNYAKNNGLWVTKDYKAGDIILYNFNTDVNSEHVGICESYSNGKITCIEGNTSAAGSQSNGGEVMRKVRSTSLVLGAYRPKYDGVSTAPASSNTNTGGVCKVELNVLKKGSKGKSVKALQILLNGYGFSCGAVDGDFGSKTLNAVRSFQSRYGLDIDGSVGPATWSKLLK